MDYFSFIFLNINFNKLSITEQLIRFLMNDILRHPKKAETIVLSSFTGCSTPLGASGAGLYRDE